MCHVNQSEVFKKLVKEKVFDVELSSIVTQEVCYSCHNISVKDTRDIFTTGHHPVKVVPSKRVVIPQEYTLNEKGEMDCGTCHTPHKELKDDPDTVFLRESNENSAMCLRCHVPLSKGPAYGEHKIMVPMKSDIEVITSRGGKLGPDNTIICETCHMVHGAPKKKMLIYYGDGDSMCFLCHDENPSEESVGHGMETHPIYKDEFKSEIPKTWPSGRKIRRSSSGNFTCETCHTAHNGYSGQLTYKNTGGEMCATCHKGKKNLDTDEIKKNHVIIQSEDKKKNISCNGCHRTHNALYDLESETTKLLVKNNDNSELCYECHGDKKTDSIIIAELSGNHPNNMPFTKTNKMRSKLKFLGAKVGKDEKGEEKIICNSCHSVHDARTDDANLIMEKNLLCLYCHYEENSLIPSSKKRGAHPNNTQPRNAIISEAARTGGQLSDTGEMICLTCHRVHSAEQESKLLAYPYDKDTNCVSCHTGMQKMFDGPHNMMNSAPDTKNRFGQTVFDGGMCSACHSLHRYSREVNYEMGNIINQVCLDCHDFNGPGQNMKRDEWSDHPMDAYVVTPFRLLALPLYSSRGDRVRRNGKIACSTCHNIHENDPAMAGTTLLRLRSNVISNICFNCHEEKMSVLGTSHDLSTVGLEYKLNVTGRKLKTGGVCSSCHVVHGETTKYAFAQDIPKDFKMQIEDDPVSIICMTCHNEDGMADNKLISEHGHPVNVPLDNTSIVKDKLPLFDANGKKWTGDLVLCSTCHDPHTRGVQESEDVAEIITMGTSSNDFLRLYSDDKVKICFICHKQEALMVNTAHDIATRGDNDKGLCQQCHSIHSPALDLFLWDYDLKIKNREDNFSQKVCFSCHNRKGFFGTEQNEKYNHPLNVGITTKYGEKKIRILLPLYEKEGQKDEDGEIVCFTCHNIHRWNPNIPKFRGGIGVEGESANSFLRISANDGYLCVHCHEKKVSLFNTEHDMRIFAPYEENMRGESPAESGPCGVCHVAHNANKEKFLLWNRNISKDAPNKLSETCFTCHKDGGAAEKKQVKLNYHMEQKETIVTYEKLLIFMNAMPFKNMPARLKETTFQLYRDNKKSDEGFLQCASCHDPHKWTHDAYYNGNTELEEGDITTSFLSLKSPEGAYRSFCSQCHSSEAEEKYIRYHKPPGADEEEEAFYDGPEYDAEGNSIYYYDEDGDYDYDDDDYDDDDDDGYYEDNYESD